MPTLTFSVCLLACFLSFTVSTEIKVKPGDDVTLQCQSPRDEAITLLEWSRPDLKTDDYVFFFRDDRLYEDYQHPSFRDRVQLRDPEMKDGNVSVILKNVNINDTGTYECRVSDGSKGQELMTTINLNVTDSGQTEEHKAEGHNPGLIVGLSVVAGLVVAGIGFVIHRQHTQHPDQQVHHRAGDPKQD